MTGFALLIFAFAVSAASLGAFSLATPILLSAGICAAVNALGLAGGFGLAPAGWSLYTALCGVRCALLLGSASLMGDGLSAAVESLAAEYLIFSAAALVWWVTRQTRRRAARRTRARRPRAA